VCDNRNEMTQADPDYISNALAFRELLTENAEVLPSSRITDVDDYLSRTFSKTDLIKMADRAGIAVPFEVDLAWLLDSLEALPPRQLRPAFDEVYVEMRDRKDRASRMSRQ